MNKEKQIEEMRYLADELGKVISTEYEKRFLADERKLEEALKANGWRKASDVAAKIITELEDFTTDNKKEILVHGHSVWFINVDDLTEFIEELKEEFKEGEKNNG